MGIQNAFILTRAKWFSNRLEIPMDSIHQYTEDLIQSTFVNEFKKHYPQTFIFSDSIQKNWSEESQKLDKVIFLKGRFPDQGVVIKKDNNEAPPYLFILHELMIGTDLDRNLYFDYTKGREEIEIKSTVKKITFIISYTLWDNLKQRPLVSSVIEIQDPFSKALTSSQLEQITQKAVHKIYDEITQGKH